MSVVLESNERLSITWQADEIIEALFTALHFDYTNIEHHGALIDIPEAWTLVGIRHNHEASEVTFVFGAEHRCELRP